jgi:hydroxymethylglutaryl-CoA lyase
VERMTITDVAPRDGLQNQPALVSTENKLRLIGLLAKAGLRHIEATSFVSPKAVPQMADAADVLAGIEPDPDLHVSVLVPNLRGLERASAAGAREIAVVLSATEEMNRKNINMGLAQAADVSEATVRAARASGISARAYVAVAWECPFEGATPLDTVVELAVRMREAGAHEIVLADTIGAAGPAQVRERLGAVLDALPASALAVHFHNTRGLGVANAWAALEAGIRRFDASTGGIGGCPFAPGAAGNLATEDLVLMAEQSGFSTGVDYHALLDAVDFAQDVLQRTVGGHSTAWARRRIQAGHRVPG